MGSSLDDFLVQNARKASWWQAWLRQDHKPQRVRVRKERPPSRVRIRIDPETKRKHDRLREARKRARKRAAAVNDLSLAQWQEIQRAYNQRCVYCGRKRPLTMDHIIPLSKGGDHTSSNIVPACVSCNSRKAARAPLVPVQPLMLTVAKAYKKRR